MKFKHTQTHELVFENGDKVSFKADDDAIVFDNFRLPRNELNEFIGLLGTLNGAAQPTKRTRKHSGTYAPAIGKDVLLRWNRKWRTDPSTSMNTGKRRGVLQKKVVAAAFKLAQKQITRGALEDKITKLTGLEHERVCYTVSHLIHTLKMLEVVK